MKWRLARDDSHNGGLFSRELPIISLVPITRSERRGIAAQETPAPDDRGWIDRHAIATVLFLTVMAGAFKFATLARPGIWYDEAQTYRRVCGKFAQMMQQLRSDGFMPLHYWMEWGLAQLVGGAGQLTPLWMRLPAAVAGTLIVPAMYWLAVQFVPRRTAVLVTAFTASSAYLNFYSHDAKMYMLLWFMCALSMSCFLVWRRTGKKLPWAGWVIASVLMVGLHALGLAIVALQLLVFVSSFGWRRRGLMALGLVLIVAGPLSYCLLFNRWAKNVREAGWEGAGGLYWVPNYNAGRTRVQLLLYPTTAYLTGWEWPARGDGQPAAAMSDTDILFQGASHGYFIPRAIRIAFESVNIVLLALVAIQVLLPFYRRRPNISWGSLLLATWLILPTAVLFAIATHPGRLLPFHGWAGVWMPRYLGIIWPAGAIVVCTLILSLPTSFLRWSAAALLLMVNCAQSVCREVLQTRPPVQQMMQDVWEARDRTGSKRTYLPRDAFDPEAADTVLVGPGKYYLCIAAGRPLFTPANWLKAPAESLVSINASDDAIQIARDVGVSPKVTELTVWHARLPGERATDDLDRMLGSQWQETSEERFVVRGVWNWSDVYICSRCRYVLDVRPRR